MNERFLANENFPAVIVRNLREKDGDVVHAAESLVGASDEAILAEAARGNRVLLTFDRDFGEMVFRRRQTPAPGIVLFRLAQLHPEAMLSFLKAFFESRPALRGFFTVASPGHFRQVRMPEFGPESPGGL